MKTYEEFKKYYSVATRTQMIEDCYLDYVQCYKQEELIEKISQKIMGGLYEYQDEETGETFQECSVEFRDIILLIEEYKNE